MSGKALEDGINLMAMNITNITRGTAEVIKAVERGDLTVRVEVDSRGELFELKETVNGMVDNLRILLEEIQMILREVGTEGRLGKQASGTNLGGVWQDLTEGVNAMANNVYHFSPCRFI